MPNIIRSDGSLEPLLRRFIDASNTKHFKEALELLFLNGSILEVYEKSGLCCLVSLTGSVDGIEESIDLVEGKMKTDLIPYLAQMSRVFLPQVIVALNQTAEISEGKDDVEIRSAVIASMVTKMSELEKSYKELTGIMISGAFIFSDLIQVGIYKGLSEWRSSHLRSGISSETYEKMISQLTKLGIIEPRLRVSVCTKCSNHELVLSNSALSSERCPKCGSEWSNAVLYVCEEQFGRSKALNKDLPLYIASYLKHQVSVDSLGQEVEVFPNAVVRDSREFEIDVYIPKYNIGIECKNFLASSIPDTVGRAQSLAGDLVQQVQNYCDAGIKHMYIVVNLSPKTIENTRSELSELCKTKGIIMPVDIVQGSPDAVSQLVNGIVALIGKDTKKKIESMLHPRLITNDEETDSKSKI